MSTWTQYLHHCKLSIVDWISVHEPRWPKDFNTMQLILGILSRIIFALFSWRRIMLFSLISWVTKERKWNYFTIDVGFIFTARIKERQTPTSNDTSSNIHRFMVPVEVLIYYLYICQCIFHVVCDSNNVFHHPYGLKSLIPL